MKNLPQPNKSPRAACSGHSVTAASRSDSFWERGLWKVATHPGSHSPVLSWSYSQEAALETGLMMGLPGTAIGGRLIDAHCALLAYAWKSSMANEGMCDSALPSQKDLLRNHKECSQQTGFSSQLLQGLPPPLRLTLPEGHLSWRHLPSVREEGGVDL